ncbi:MAG: DUF370 domain-containing protein [Acidaminococcaceae bacterium]|nr:DUF370 domain-containing protein [Acidaminococcaceae bacterium]MBQ9635874.1 DUF370 domain-containing protein [Acidaminococcaceae bacterium]
MYVHLGRGCMLQSFQIIGIFSVGEDKNFYRNLKNDKGRFYEVEDLSEDGTVDSVILTKDKIYLSAISALTLQKRINQNLIYNNGGNNGREK